MQEQLTHSVCLLFAWPTAEKCRRETAFYLFAAGTPAVQLILRALGPQRLLPACISRQPFVKSLHSKFLKHLHARTMPPGAWNFDYQRSAVFCVYVCEINNTCELHISLPA
jgi:hypothetical protein